MVTVNAQICNSVPAIVKGIGSAIGPSENLSMRLVRLIVFVLFALLNDIEPMHSIDN